MKRRALAVSAFLSASLLAPSAGDVALAQETRHATLTIRAGEPGAKISRHLYGHFAEHLGRCIYDGVWVGPGSTIPNTRGIRKDVVEALRKIRIPNLPTLIVFPPVDPRKRFSCDLALQATRSIVRAELRTNVIPGT